MPIATENEISRLIAQGAIGAITLDTSIFDEKRLQLNSTILSTMASLANRNFDFILDGTVHREVEMHLINAAESALRLAKSAVGLALGAFNTSLPTRDNIIEQITGGVCAKEIGRHRLQKYIADTGCEILEDAELVDTKTIYDAYFEGKPPFGPGKKKHEFPDALALNALEEAASRKNRKTIVVSKDGDWESFCNASMNLFILSDLERALSLVANLPDALKRSVEDWMLSHDGRREFESALKVEVERIDFAASGYPTWGQMEATTWGGVLKDIIFPEQVDIDFIDASFDGGGQNDVTITFPLQLVVQVQIEMNFSVWDSVDRESVGMGGRTIDYDAELNLRATTTVDVRGLGEDNDDYSIKELEIDDYSHEIDLGEVSLFEPEEE